MKRFFFLLTLISFSFVPPVKSNPSLQVQHLTCEYIENPLGIDAAHPRLSWNLFSGERDQLQSAYEIIVSDNEKDIKLLKGNIWQTGKVSSAQNIQIEYGGTALVAFTKYFWRVKVFDKNNVESWSPVASFETAALQPGDWKAKWISDGSKNPAKDEDYYKDDRMPLFRKEFAVKKKITKARLYISGVGYYEMFLNGKKVGDHVLDPGFTTYRKQVLYVTYDITALIVNGKNAAGIMLGNGWWNPLPMLLFGRFDLRKVQQTGRPCVKAEMHISYDDGSSENIITDQSWQTAAGPVIKNNVYLGEKYDARLEQKNWNTINNTKAGWNQSVEVGGPSGILTAQMQPAIRITKVIRPVSISEFRPDTFIVNMGENFAGVARIKVKGPAGTKVTLRYGEMMFADSTLNVMTTVAAQIKKGGIRGGPGAPETAWQQDEYILKGEGTEIWQPRFTFHGFQYLEITGWPGRPALADIEGLRMNSDLPAAGDFECSNQMFNQLHKTIQQTFLSNVFSVQSDCPGREKMGYGADMVVSSGAFLYDFNMANFYRKAVKDFANEQRPEGGITEIAPSTGIADKGYGDESGPLGWQLAFPYLQKQLYDFYGDKEIIADHYEAFKKQLVFLETKSVDELFYWDIGDHEAIDPKPEALTAAAFYYHHVLLGAEFAGILNKKDDSIKYARQAFRIKQNIIDKFLVPSTGRFDNGTQSAQIFALWYGFSPEKENTIKALLKEFERHDWHVSTGTFSTKMMFDVLRENDMNEIAYKIADQKTYPGWGNMLANGATTLWETWKFPGTVYSGNHPMFGSVDEWFYRSLLGINAASPGFQKIIIKPQPAGDLLWAKGSYHSIQGVIKSEWKIENGQFNLHVSIPANTTATIYLPSKENQAITESGKTVKINKYENKYAVVEVGSGDYHFRSQY